jgi:hypothetical protein
MGGEYLFGARWPGAEDLGNFLYRRCPAGASGALKQDHEVVVTFARDLTSAPRARQHNGRVAIDVDRPQLLAALQESTFRLGPRDGDVLKADVGGYFETGDAAGGAHV